jgi:hypothetical protein
LRNDPANDFFARTVHQGHGSAEASHRGASRARMPSSAGYLLGAFVAALALFAALWWMLVSGGDESPWIPAGLAASVVLLVALSAREVVMRRAWTRYLLEQGGEPSGRRTRDKKSGARKSRSSSLLSGAWRTIQKQSEEAEASSAPEPHFEVFNLCQDYLTSTEEALRSNNLPAEKRIALKAGQERVRALQKHHLLTWARDSSRALTYEAQQRGRISDKIEAANRALHCLESAQKFYPNEIELRESTVAIHEFIASVKVAHWVELAERSAFKGHHRRAIERYKDALFYLNRETVRDEVRIPGTERISREIEMLRGRLREQKQSEARGSRAGEERQEDAVPE